MTLRIKLLAFVQISFAGMVLVGSAFEVMNLLLPTLIPEIQANPVMALHRSQPVVYWWTLLSNIATGSMAVVLALSGIGVLKGRRKSSQTSVFIIKAFLLVLIGASVVSGTYLLPQQISMLHSASRSLALIMIVSIASALFGLTAVLFVLWFGHATILRSTAAA
jgi:hypothetical protein